MLFGTADGLVEVISDALCGCSSEIKTDALAMQERGHIVLTRHERRAAGKAY